MSSYLNTGLLCALLTWNVVMSQALQEAREDLSALRIVAAASLGLSVQLQADLAPICRRSAGISS